MLFRSATVHGVVFEILVRAVADSRQARSSVTGRSSRTMDGALLLSESPTGIVKEGLFPNGILHVASSGHEGFVCSSAGVWH